MDRTSIEDVIKGIGVIIDDEINTPESPISRLVSSIETEGKIPLVKYDAIPDDAAIESMGNVSFVVLDWKFQNNSKLSIDGVFPGAELTKDSSETVISFLTSLLNKCFVPVFLITGQNYEEVKGSLIENGLYNDTEPNRIMLKAKGEISDYSHLIDNIAAWLHSNPSAFALKLWDKSAVLSKNRMFLDLYQASPNWVHVILKCMKEDANDNPKTINNEFNVLLNNNFINRIKDGNYYALNNDEYEMPDKEVIRQVLEGERFIKYDSNNTPDISYLGDLYKEKDTDKYWVNIRAQCDLIREENPKLLLIGGTEIDVENIIKPISIKLSGGNNGNVLKINDNSYNCNVIAAYSKKERGLFNKSFQDLKTSFEFSKGEVLEKKKHSIIPCVAGKTLLGFDYQDFMVAEQSEMEGSYVRIGRIIAPYITKIQKNYTSYLIREGLMAVPESLLF